MLRATPGWRRIRPAAEDFACCLCELVDLDFAEAEQVRVVMDNQSRRAACCGGWSSITRPSTPADLESEIAAWLKRRNATGAPINWMVTSEKAREKVRRAYPNRRISKHRGRPPRKGPAAPWRCRTNSGNNDRRLPRRG